MRSGFKTKQHIGNRNLLRRWLACVPPRIPVTSLWLVLPGAIANGVTLFLPQKNVIDFFSHRPYTLPSPLPPALPFQVTVYPLFW